MFFDKVSQASPRLHNIPVLSLILALNYNKWFLTHLRHSLNILGYRSCTVVLIVRVDSCKDYCRTRTSSWFAFHLALQRCGSVFKELSSL